MNRTILVSLPVLLALVGGCGTKEPEVSPVAAAKPVRTAATGAEGEA